MHEYIMRDKSVLTRLDASSTDASDYETNGFCVDSWEFYGEAASAGFALAGAALVPPLLSSSLLSLQVLEGP